MFTLNEIDVKGLTQFNNMIGALGDEAPKVVSHAINRTGDMARTRVVRELAKQTSLPQKTIKKAVKVKRSSWRSLEYELSSSGGDISLKYFKARETRLGVSAHILGKRKIFKGSFIRGGSFKIGRVDLNMSGHVFQRIGNGNKIEKLKSGVFIPIEMVQGRAAKAFSDVVADVLPRRLDHEINRVLGKV